MYFKNFSALECVHVSHHYNTDKVARIGPVRSVTHRHFSFPHFLRSRKRPPNTSFLTVNYFYSRWVWGPSTDIVRGIRKRSSVMTGAADGYTTQITMNTVHVLISWFMGVKYVHQVGNLYIIQHQACMINLCNTDVAKISYKFETKSHHRSNLICAQVL